MSCDIGLVGLAVMGENLVLNMESRGFKVAVYNRTTSKVTAFVEGRAKDKQIVGCMSAEEMVKNLKAPRKVMIMVMAGAVDKVINGILPLLSKGDIIIDGGNSNWELSNRRTRELEGKGFLFIGAGVSGGEEGALLGPSIMPGGSPEAWPHVKPIFQAISAKVDDGSPCCDWVGRAGAGHFVKMVHNGIEYGDMQLISEAYVILHEVLGYSNEEMGAIFADWNKGQLDSYLIEITSEIFLKKDPMGEPYVLDNILDKAGQKGTGKWTAQAGLEFGIPVTLIGEAVFARCLSSLKDERGRASKILPAEKVEPFAGDKAEVLEQLKAAVYAAKLVSYAQGFALLRAAAAEQDWKLNYGSIALMWRGGCIIRSKFLGKIKDAYDQNPELENLLLDPYFLEQISAAVPGWRQVACMAISRGIPVPAITSALSWYDGYRKARGNANLIQAQRDYFGAHTYERLDKPRGEHFHTNWTGRGGTTSASTYNA